MAIITESQSALKPAAPPRQPPVRQGRDRRGSLAPGHAEDPAQEPLPRRRAQVEPAGVSRAEPTASYSKLLEGFQPQTQAYLQEFDTYFSRWKLLPWACLEAL